MYSINLDLASKQEDIIQFYLLYKNNDISELPNSFWNADNGKYRAAIIVRYVIENILKYNKKIEVIRNLSIKDFKENNLNNMLQILFHNDIFLTIDNAYPGVYKKCMFGRVRNYWDAELIMEEMERIAAKLNKEAKDLKIMDINNSDFIGGERVFQTQFGGFDNFMDKYYPQKHWWIPRRAGQKRIPWTDIQEKEAITYVLVEKLGIDLENTKIYHHVTVRDFYKEHMRFLCKKYNYDVQAMISKYYPDLKICMYKSSTYMLISPTGKTYITNCLLSWIKEYRTCFPENVKISSIRGALLAAAKPENSYHSYHKWKIKKMY